jgi:hypothetical protein
MYRQREKDSGGAHWTKRSGREKQRNRRETRVYSKETDRPKDTYVKKGETNAK